MQPVVVFSAIVVILTLYYKFFFTIFSLLILASFLHQKSYVKVCIAAATAICTLQRDVHPLLFVGLLIYGWNHNIVLSVMKIMPFQQI